MDNLGRQAVINQDQGVYWAGLWLSNTYAWSASNTAKANPENDLTLWESQILENPDKPKINSYSYNYNSYNYGYGNYSSYGSKNSIDNANDYVDRELDLIVNDFFDLGYDKAGSLSYTQAKRFISRFGLASFQDLAIMVMDNQIDEKCKNISRGCYLSYDPNMYFNPDAPIFYKLLPKKEVKYEKQQARNPYYVNSA